MSRVTFETSCYENDYQFILNGNHLKTVIDNCNYKFNKRVVLINNVLNRKKVACLAEECKRKDIIDDYFFIEDYAKQVLDFFEIKKDDFEDGYYYLIPPLVGIYLCQTDYLLHFTTDAFIEKQNNSEWINDAIKKIEADPSKYFCANPFWADRDPLMSDGFIERDGDWFVGHGFSDQCFLAPSKLFKGKIYNEKNKLSENYPVYAGQPFEKRIDSYMRNHGLLRLTNGKINYTHKNFPQKFSAITLKLINRFVKKLKRQVRF